MQVDASEPANIEHLPLEILHQCLSFIDISSIALLMSLNRNYQQVSSSYLLSFGLNNNAKSSKPLRLRPHQYASIIDNCKYCESFDSFDLLLFNKIDTSDKHVKLRTSENTKLWNSIVALLKRNANNLEQFHINLSNVTVDSSVIGYLNYIPQVRSFSLAFEQIIVKQLADYLSRFNSLIYLRLHALYQQECMFHEKQPPKLFELFKSLETVDFQGICQELFFDQENSKRVEEDTPVTRYTIFDVCPNVKHIAMCNKAYAFIRNEKLLESLEYKTMKVASLRLTGAQIVLDREIPAKDARQWEINDRKLPLNLKPGLCLFPNLKVLEITELSTIEPLQSLQFPKSLEEVTLNASVACGIIGKIVVASQSYLKKLVVNGSQSEWINTLRSDLAISAISSLHLQSLTINSGCLHLDSLLYIFSICPELVRFTARDCSSDSAVENVYANSKVPLRYIDIGNTTLHQFPEIMSMCSETIESIKLHKVYFNGVTKGQFDSSPWGSPDGDDIVTASNVAFPSLTTLAIDECSRGTILTEFLTSCTMDNLSRLSLRQATWLSEDNLINFMEKTPKLSQFNGEGMECSDKTLLFLAEKKYLVKELDMAGKITEDGLLALQDETVANLEKVAVMGQRMHNMDKIIQFISKCHSLQVLKINMGQTQYPNDKFFETLATRCPNLKLVICGGRGSEDVSAATIEKFVLSCKHLRVFVLDFCPKGLSSLDLVRTCRATSNRSAIPTVILPRMTNAKNPNGYGYRHQPSRLCSLQ
jgi:hypothetical protein